MEKLCEACGGTGQIIITDWTFDGDSDRQIPDNQYEEPCEECGGSGLETSDIDTSDIPEIDETWFARARLRKPKTIQK